MAKKKYTATPIREPNQFNLTQAEVRELETAAKLIDRYREYIDARLTGVTTAAIVAAIEELVA